MTDATRCVLFISPAMVLFVLHPLTLSVGRPLLGVLVPATIAGLMTYLFAMIDVFALCRRRLFPRPSEQIRGFISFVRRLKAKSEHRSPYYALVALVVFGAYIPAAFVWVIASNALGGSVEVGIASVMAVGFAWFSLAGGVYFALLRPEAKDFCGSDSD